MKLEALILQCTIIGLIVQILENNDTTKIEPTS